MNDLPASPIGPELDPWTFQHKLDRGPVYAETIFTRLIAEPWNAVTAFAFVVLVLIWLYRLRHNWRQHAFLLLCLPILLAGGIGGTIYHALRQYYSMFLLDVVPIVLLIVAGAIYLWIRLKPRWWYVVLMLAFLGGVQLSFLFVVERHVAINLHYGVMALFVLIPLAIVMVRTRFRYINLIALGLVCFGFALLFRFLDVLRPPLLPMGTHWLWHLGGVTTTAILSEYFYRIETEPIAPLPCQLRHEERGLAAVREPAAATTE